MRDDRCRTDLERLAGSGGVAGRWEEKSIFETGQNGCNFLYQNITGRPFLTSAWSGVHYGEAGGVWGETPPAEFLR